MHAKRLEAAGTLITEAFEAKPFDQEPLDTDTFPNLLPD